METIQVFEHDRLHVGQPVATADGAEARFSAEHHATLAAFADATSDRYLTCGRRTTRFSSYVGLIQVGHLCIEVLPKADRSQAGGHGQWHRALVHMLRTVGDLGLEAPDEASLAVRPGRLFDLFIDHFLDECERLLREGLAKGYRGEERNGPTFRGRLLVTQQARYNATNAARFYVATSTYDHANLPNLVLREALEALLQIPTTAAAGRRVLTLRHRFPDLPRWRPQREQLDGLRLGRKTARYRQALRLASMILFHVAPNVIHGRTPLLALLFDMNLLWERYVATLARRLRAPGVEASAQASKAFWRAHGGRRSLRPDLVLRDAESKRTLLVVDTKWKVPSGEEASSADLKQMFCYHELFDCPRTLLLYPSPSDQSFVGSRGEFMGRGLHLALAYLSVSDAPDALWRLLSGSVSATTGETAALRTGAW